MLENAVRVCDAKFGTLFRFDGYLFDLAAQFGTPAKLVEFQKQRGPFQPLSGGGLDRLMQTKEVVRIDDDAAEPVLNASTTLGGAHSIIFVPMLKEEAVIGAIIIYRQEIRPF